jgi:hypothetical protein
MTVSLRWRVSRSDERGLSPIGCAGGVVPTLSPVARFAAGLFRDKGPLVDGDADLRPERRG